MTGIYDSAGPLQAIHEENAEPAATLDREQPVHFGPNGDGTGGCSRPVSFTFGGI